MSILMIVLTVAAAWLLVSVLLALAIGRAVKLADRDHRRRVAARRPAPAPAGARVRVSA
jgi:predicted membrane-bound mannosyltransferase